MEEKPYEKYFLEEREEKNAAKVFYIFVAVFIVLFFAFVGINYSFNQKYTYITISGESMQPTLNPTPAIVATTQNGVIVQSAIQDGVYVEKTQDIDYDDIIIIENVFKDKSIIKRALAFEGDYITIAKIRTEQNVFEFRFMRVKAGSDQVEVLPEQYIKSHWEWAFYYSPSSNQIQDSASASVVYEEEFFQTFRHAYDSKYFSVDEAEGAQVKFFKVPDDEVFYMGDNRINSTDSRIKGTTEMTNVVGKVVQIVHNGAYYQGNIFHSFHRIGGYFAVIWQEILGFFGARA